MAIKTTIQFRRDTLANWTSENPVLKAGEIALVDKNNGVGAKLWVMRVGDGTTPFTGLPETAYALSSDVSALGVSVLESAKTYTNTVAAALENEISNKVKIEGVPTDYINVSRVDAETYHDIITQGTADPKTIYIVSCSTLLTPSSQRLFLRFLQTSRHRLTTLIQVQQNLFPPSAQPSLE